MILPVLLTMLVSLALQLPIRALLLRFNFLDRPNERSSHHSPIPRGAGIAVMLAILVGFISTGSRMTHEVGVFAAIVMAFATIGLIEDRFGVPAIWRLVSQFGLSVVGVWSLIGTSQSESLNDRAYLLASVLAIVWVTAFTNAYNFMDGIDGISALSAIVAFGSYAWLGLSFGVPDVTTIGLVLAAAALGFLPWNLPRAKVFLGDVGSYGLGSGVALTATLAAKEGVPIALCLSPCILYIADTGYALLRRLLGGYPIMHAHRDHIYQRLVDQGFSHGGVALSVSAGSILTVAAMGASRVLGVAVSAVMIGSYIASPVLVARLRSGGH